MSDAEQIDLAGLVRAREVAEARWKRIGKAVLREVVATADDELPARLRALKAELVGEAATVT